MGRSARTAKIFQAPNVRACSIGRALVNEPEHMGPPMSVGMRSAGPTTSLTSPSLSSTGVASSRWVAVAKKALDKKG
jgi:hypothetical protein